MRRSDEEFKLEVLRRSNAYIRKRKERRHKFIVATVSIATVPVAACLALMVLLGNPSGYSGKSMSDAGNVLQEQNTAVVAVDLFIREDGKESHRYYSNSTMNADNQEMTKVLELVDEIERLRAESDEHQVEAEDMQQFESVGDGLSTGSASNNSTERDMSCEIIIKREDGTTDTYNIFENDGRFYEEAYKLELQSESLKSLKKIVEMLRSTEEETSQ